MKASDFIKSYIFNADSSAGETDKDASLNFLSATASLRQTARVLNLHVHRSHDDVGQASQQCNAHLGSPMGEWLKRLLVHVVVGLQSRLHHQ